MHRATWTRPATGLEAIRKETILSLIGDTRPIRIGSQKMFNRIKASPNLRILPVQ